VAPEENFSKKTHIPVTSFECSAGLSTQQTAVEKKKIAMKELENRHEGLWAPK
jgi:hypothetical protein